MAQERTEAATPKRRADARRRGQVARSQEVVSTAGLLGGLLILQIGGTGLLGGLGEQMRHSLASLTTAPPTVADLSAGGLALGLRLLLLLAPPLGGLMLIGVVANLAQVGLLFTAYPLRPDISRLDPIKGFGRLFSPRAGVELAKTLVKLGLVGWIAYGVFMERAPSLVALTGADPLAAGAATAAAVFELAFKATLGLLLLAVLDYGYQRWQHERSLRMSLQEVRDEYRQSEGDPQLRARIRRTQRQMASRRMMQAVPTSDVVLTNPTHLAVALRYDAARMAAPVVTAKGADLIAERIKSLAREHRVPVVENKPLARALYTACEIDEPVPAALYQAVAEVLAFIYSLRRPGGRGPTDEVLE
jgi:flagellar biosynthetic protein FlhB